LASKAALQAAGVSSGGGVRVAAPAELTRTSMDPSRPSTASIKAAAAAASAQSAGNPTAPGS
jgi:hypothetical protein